MPDTPTKRKNPATDKALVRALERRDAAGLQRALLDGADLDRELGPTHWTPLHKACADGWVAGVELITSFPGASKPPGGESSDPECNVLCLAAPHGMMLVHFLMRKGFALSTAIGAGAIEARLPETERPLWQHLYRAA